MTRQTLKDIGGGAVCILVLATMVATNPYWLILLGLLAVWS